MNSGNLHSNTNTQDGENALHYTRVLVVGSGIAGTCAALRAAETLYGYKSTGTGDSAGDSAHSNASYNLKCTGNGAGEHEDASNSAGEHAHTQVMLACTGPVFSGSSFFEGTWGLGLIAPTSTADEADLAQTIIRIGCGVANEPLVHSFVAGIRPAIAQLEHWGVTLKRATEGAGNQREYIPCFDHKQRAWYGIERAPYVNALQERLANAGVCTHSGWQLLDIDTAAQVATFFVAEHNPEHNPECTSEYNSEHTSTQPNEYNPERTSQYTSKQPRFVHVRYEALVLCTGGASSLFSRHLTTPDCSATIQGLAAQRGCALVNMAFLQFMPGIVSPIQNVVFNEKTFRYMQLDAKTTSHLGGEQKTQELLALRSTYGPFTSRLESCALDFAIHRAGATGLALTPHFDTANPIPEFVQTYQTWLEQTAGVSAATPVRIAVYAHAHNGGIAIDANAATNVHGIFAAGECTGGMHGADRLGGLSSANGLVFGMRAGTHAAKFALQASREHARRCGACDARTPYQHTWEHRASSNAPRIEHELRTLMDNACMIVRERSMLERALSRINELVGELSESSTETNDATHAAQTRTTHLRLLTAREMVQDMLQQPPRCGSHYCC